MVAVTILHLALLHEVGSSNPLGIIQEECINLYPFFIVKDIFGFLIFASV
jgi:ubiquinol-cytochrome c reductase cytochrome b subunit